MLTGVQHNTHNFHATLHKATTRNTKQKKQINETDKSKPNRQKHTQIRNQHLPIYTDIVGHLRRGLILIQLKHTHQQ